MSFGDVQCPNSLVRRDRNFGEDFKLFEAAHLNPILGCVAIELFAMISNYLRQRTLHHIAVMMASFARRQTLHLNANFMLYGDTDSHYLMIGQEARKSKGRSQKKFPPQLQLNN